VIPSQQAIEPDAVRLGCRACGLPHRQSTAADSQSSIDGRCATADGRSFLEREKGVFDVDHGLTIPVDRLGLTRPLPQPSRGPVIHEVEHVRRYGSSHPASDLPRLPSVSGVLRVVKLIQGESKGQFRYCALGIHV
jgi:hypothetical protein